jgi:demethylmenaquinone methyltransferase/2-methoxy-6-polyprenyl-1,4-benzoquinol methylase
MDFVEGNAEKLPFYDNSFDLYTIAFGLRNVTNKEQALSEAYRVLRPGGRLMVLEFSSVTQPLFRQVYDQFSFQVIPLLGELVAKDKVSYQYLVESIRRFPNQDTLLQMIRAQGFQCCSYVNFTLGVVAVHTGYKLK